MRATDKGEAQSGESEVVTAEMVALARDLFEERWREIDRINRELAAAHRRLWEESYLGRWERELRQRRDDG